MSWNDIQVYLESKEREFYIKFNDVSNNDLPSWVLGTNNVKDEFKSAQSKWKNLSIFEKWAKGVDLEIIKRSKEILLNLQKRVLDKDRYGPLTDYMTIQWIKNYEEPKTNRPLYMLLDTYSIWQMSRLERKKLHDYWRTKIQEELLEELSDLQRSHEKIRQEINEIYFNI